MKEVEKYDTLYKLPDYRKYSPGKRICSGMPVPRSLISFGCGTGMELDYFIENGCRDIQAVDFSVNSLSDVYKDKVDFIVSDIYGAPVRKAELGICIDVLEHIPKDIILKTINYIVEKTDKQFFSVALTQDTHGDIIGQKLHITMEDANWWVNIFRRSDMDIYEHSIVHIGTGRPKKVDVSSFKALS